MNYLHYKGTFHVFYMLQSRHLDQTSSIIKRDQRVMEGMKYSIHREAE